MVFMKILIVFGTRPEAIKMAPLVEELLTYKEIEVHVCLTAQHREMLDQVVRLFEIKPSFDLNLMTGNQSLTDISSDIVRGVGDVCSEVQPDLMLVHGDTATTLAAGLAAYYSKIPLGHVEAGLRTWNIHNPWPEEGNRKAIGALASYHFAPTEISKENLLNENVDESSIFVTGNTVIDALHSTLKKLEGNSSLMERMESIFDYLTFDKDIILVTGHRRENFGEKFYQICDALKRIAQAFPNTQIIYPVHLNPNVRGPVYEILSNIPNIFLVDPLDYLPFIFLMSRSKLILTDSGGIQEEAPSLGKPVLVLRTTSERPEAISAGTVKLVGTEPSVVFKAVSELLTDKNEYEKMSKATNPYGDGKACRRIADIIFAEFGLNRKV